MVIIEGSIAVKAAIDSKYRKVETVYLDESKRSSDIQFIKGRCREKNIKVKTVAKEEIAKLAKGKTHGGILAYSSERKFQSVTSLLMAAKPRLLLIEGVEDSFNLGYIMRTAYALGFNGLIMAKREFDFEDETIIKSSAGASELLPVCLSDDLKDLLATLKNRKIEIFAAYRGGNCKSIYEADFKDKPLVMAVGGPKRGLSKDVLDSADQFVYIPYDNDFHNALNASSALAVIAGEIFRVNH